MKINFFLIAAVILLCLDLTYGDEDDLGRKRITSYKRRKSPRKGIKYCGAQDLPPKKDLVCKEICGEGQCRNFYCECQDEEPLKQKCLRATDKSKCIEYCSKGSYSSAYHCPKRELKLSEYYCFCA